MGRHGYFFRQLLTLIAAVGVPLLMLHAYTLRQSSELAREAAYRAVENYAASVAQDAEALLVDTEQYLVFLASRPLILALDSRHCDPLLEGVTERRRHVANVLVSTIGGEPTCLSVTGPGAVPTSLTQFEWVRLAIAANAMTISKPFMAPVARRMVAAMSRPLYDANKVRIGTVTALLDLESLQSEWSRYALPPNSRISIFDADGTVLVTRPDFHAHVGKDASASLMQAKSLNAGDVGIAPGLDGIQRAFALRPISAARWTAGAAIPTEDVFGPYAKQQKESLAVAAAVIAAVIALALLIARRMVAPLHGLLDTARAIRRGQTDARAREDVPGEFHEVAREFNSMLEAGRRHADFYKALSRTNGAIVRMPDAKSLYDEICRICVEHGHASIAYVSLVAGESMTHVAWAGPADAFVQNLNVRIADKSVNGSGLSGLAAFTGARQISNDVYEDPRTLPWREFGAAIGTKAIAACPFRAAGKTAGTLTLHMTSVDFFDDRVIALLDEMTEDISFALDNFARTGALVHKEQQLAGMVDTAMDAIISIDSHHKISLFNRAAGDMFQIEPQVALGTTIDKFLPPQSRSVHQAHLARFSATGSTARRMGMTSLTAVRADGSEFPIDASISMLGEGATALMTVVIRDATELRLAQESRLAQVAAESANKAKTDFLSRMSHELRTPLNAVIGFSQLLQTDVREPLTDGQFGHVERIRLAGWHLLALVNDVLDVSQIESGHLSLHEVSVDLFGVLDEAVRIAQIAASDAKVDMIGSYSEATGARVWGDPRRLRQVMINLLSNAVKYNRPQGSVEVRVTRADDLTHIDVIDSGIGMDVAQLGQLYQPFNRLGREKGGVDGTGLGLTLTRQLVGLMRGTIDVRSVVGIGTKVRVTLHTSTALAPAMPAPEGAQAADRPDRSPPRGVVLYIEDNLVNFMLVEHLLGRWPGVTLLHAENGTNGLAIARTTAIDLILLDMRLPDMDGLDVLRELRGRPATAQVRVVSLSASAMPEEVDAAGKAGALHYWTKPLDFAQFTQEMERLLGRR